jgi:CRP-like cAMP-binding protein
LNNSIIKHWPSFLILCIAISGCAGTRPVAYSGIASSSQMKPNSQDKSGRVQYSFSTHVDWRNYTGVIVAPVTVYRGPDSQFAEISEEDKNILARYMQERFSEKLAERFQITNAPSPNTLRIELTLTGAKTSTPVVSTFTHFDLAGGPYNVVQGIRGKEGMLTGDVTYAVEIYDASTNRLLNAYVEKQYPSAMNVKATVGALSASKTGIQKGADALVAKLN